MHQGSELFTISLLSKLQNSLGELKMLQKISIIDVHTITVSDESSANIKDDGKFTYHS